MPALEIVKVSETSKCVSHLSPTPVRVPSPSSVPVDMYVRRHCTLPILDVAATCENIGLVLKQQGEVEKAKVAFEEAAYIRRAKLGAHHALTKKSERLAANCL